MSELTNQARADAAKTVLKVFTQWSGQRLIIDRQDVVGDLIANLMHWCDRNGVDFESALSMARYHHQEEVKEET